MKIVKECFSAIWKILLQWFELICIKVNVEHASLMLQNIYFQLFPSWQIFHKCFKLIYGILSITVDILYLQMHIILKAFSRIFLILYKLDFSTMDCTKSKEIFSKDNSNMDIKNKVY